MNRIKTIVFLILVTCLVMPLSAQNTSTQGKEFWLSFMHNGFRNHESSQWIINQVIISAKRDCSGTITNPLTGWEQSFNVRANNITTIDVPEAQGYHDRHNFETISNKGLKITANDTISVYCTNIAYVSFDASFVLPTESLGDEYIIQCHDQSTAPATTGSDVVAENQTSAFVIIATEDNTVVDITPSCITLNGRPAGETFSITMNAGETYHVRSNRSSNNRDLSGTHILAADCKKIAVFNGNTLTCIPITVGNGYDHIFEQDMPLRSWGKQFVVTSSLNRNRDFVKITSSANNNVITKNGEPLTTLQAYESYTFSMSESERSCFIQADQPCAVYLYNNSSRDQNPIGGQGDPSTVWIAPVEQRINDVTFSTFDHANINIESQHVNIIVNSEDVAEVYFDGQQISPLLFNRVNGNNNYSYIRMDISHGVHHIVCAHGFNAHVYGFGYAKGYAYLVGSNAIDLSTNLTINNESIAHNGTFPYCSEEPITFSVEVNLPDYTLLWDFGDGTTSTQNPVNHTYHERRVYPVSLVVTSEEGGCTGSASDTTRFFVDATQQYIIENDEICAGMLYSGYGFNDVLINNDTILARLEDNPIHSECKDSLLVYVTANQSYHVPITDSRCWQDGGGIYDGYGFSFEYNEPGTYERTQELQTVGGCDSIVTLTLTVADRITHEFDHYECTGTYLWDGRPYTEAGDYEWVYTSPAGCDSLVTLHLTMGAIQQTEFDTILCGSFIWDDIEYNTSGDYSHVYTAVDGCDSIVTCHLNVSGNVEGPTESLSECDQYEWYGTAYTESGLYSHVLSSTMGCDSTLYLQLNIDYTPTPTPIYPVDTSNHSPHWVITATEFQVNHYEYHLWDENPLSRWDTVTWNFDREIDWLIEPIGAKGKECRVYVLSQVEDTIWLEANVRGVCDTANTYTQRYWLLSSFYGTDEHFAMPEINVMPNPNNGQMTLCFGEMEGQVLTTVYDMQGKAIDRFELFVTPNSRHSYTQKGGRSGIYLFVFNHNGKVGIQKVFITN